MVGLGLHLFPVWGDSAGLINSFYLFRGVISHKTTGQMLPCQPTWATSGRPLYT